MAANPDRVPGCSRSTDGLLSDCEPLNGGYALAYLIGAGPMVPACGAPEVGEESAESMPDVPPGRHNERGG
jgi:hypothetical protein